MVRLIVTVGDRQPGWLDKLEQALHAAFDTGVRRAKMHSGCAPCDIAKPYEWVPVPHFHRFSTTPSA